MPINFLRFMRSGTWTTPNGMYFKHPDGTWKQARKFYHRSTYNKTGDDFTGPLAWHFLGYVAAPTESVPSPVVTYPGTKGNLTIDVSWATVTSSDFKYEYFVRVTWIVNGNTSYADETQQYNGKLSRDFMSGDSVEIQIAYVNNVGVGPVTNLGTVFVDDGGGA